MMDIFSLSGKIVVLTGGCGDLGQTMTNGLLEYGACVAIADLSDRLPQEFAQAKKDGKLKVFPCDLSQTESINAMFAAVEQDFGKIDVLINNAAYGGGAGGKSCEFRLDYVDDETWETGIDGTLNITFRCIRGVLPYFEKQKKGVLVNIASMYGVIAPDFTIYGDDIPWSPPTYGAGKAGVIQLTRYCASALAARGIRANSITPGPFPKVTEKSNMEFIGRLQNKTMLKRTGKAPELLGALLLLASDASSFMTGTNIVVDGGMTAL